MVVVFGIKQDRPVDLLQVSAALHEPGGGAGFHGDGHNQRRQHRKNRQTDQQVGEGEPLGPGPGVFAIGRAKVSHRSVQRRLAVAGGSSERFAAVMSTNHRSKVCSRLSPFPPPGCGSGRPRPSRGSSDRLVALRPLPRSRTAGRTRSWRERPWPSARIWSTAARRARWPRSPPPAAPPASRMPSTSRISTRRSRATVRQPGWLTRWPIASRAPFSAGLLS